jgi:hypothetical protein
MKHPGFIEQNVEKYIRQLEGFRHRPECWDVAIKITGHIEEALLILEQPMDPYSRRITTALRMIKEPKPTSQDVSLGVLEGFVKVEEAKQQQQEVPEVEL